MRLKADQGLMAEWGEKFVSFEKAAEELMSALGCSHSKAEKLAKGVYPFALGPLEQVALSEVTKIKRTSLFPEPSKAKARAS